RYPGSTLTAVLLNLRPDHPEFRDPAVRTALLAAIDRVGLIDQAYASVAAPAPGPIPPSSPLFDPAAEPIVDYSVADATKALKKAGWWKKDDGWYLPGAKKPLSIEVLSTLEGTNPAVFAAAEKVVADWKALGLDATHTALPAAELVTDRLSAGKFAAAI